MLRLGNAIHVRLAYKVRIKKLGITNHPRQKMNGVLNIRNHVKMITKMTSDMNCNVTGSSRNRYLFL
jgi:hypothetical protein